MNAELASKFQLLRVRIESSVKTPSVIMVTSARTNDGKSLTAYGLAECLWKVGHRAVYVDTAPRSTAPRIDRTGQSVVPSVPMLWLSSEESGLTASRDAIAAFVNRMRADYDYTIIDAAPLMTNSVAMLLASAVDAVLLAVRHGRPPGEDDELMVQTLRHLKAKVLGVIASSGESIADIKKQRDGATAAEARVVAVDPRVEDVPGSALFAR